MKIIIFIFFYFVLFNQLRADTLGEKPGKEIHQRLNINEKDKIIALTLDACGGSYDPLILDTLIKNKIPATIFLTKKWIENNPEAVKKYEKTEPFLRLRITDQDTYPQS